MRSIILSGLLAITVSGQVPAVTQQSPPPIAFDTAYWAWLTEKWTGSDQPYEQLRSRIDAAIAHGQKPDNLLGQYKALALRQSNSPQAQFAWGYAAYRAARAEITNFNERQRKLIGVATALDRVPSPHAYQYARLRFLLNDEFPTDAKLRIVGERLVRRNPQDWDVKHCLIRLLFYTTMFKPIEKQEALKYAQELCQFQPKKPRSYATLGTVYYASWMANHNKEDATKAIAAYRKWLQVAPANDEGRQIAARSIKELQRS